MTPFAEIITNRPAHIWTRLEVGIYNRKQEGKKKIKERKHALDQESDLENDQEKKKDQR